MDGSILPSTPACVHLRLRFIRRLTQMDTEMQGAHCAPEQLILGKTRPRPDVGCVLRTSFLSVSGFIWKRETHPTHHCLFTEIRFTLPIRVEPAPIRGVKALGQEPVKGGIRPVRDFPGIAMLNRIPVDIVQMSLEICIIPDLMLPEAPLPKPGLLTDLLRSAQHGWAFRRLPTLTCLSFDNGPARGVIRVTRRQGPNGVYMIRQENPGFNGKGHVLPQLQYSFPQGFPDDLGGQDRTAQIGIDGKKISGALDFKTAISGHWRLGKVVRKTHPTLFTANDSFDYH